MRIQATSLQSYQPKFKGRLEINPRNMDIIDLNLFMYGSGDIAEFVGKQKHDYLIEKAFNQIHIFLVKDGKPVDERLVHNYTDGNGYKHIENVFSALKNFAKDITN